MTECPEKRRSRHTVRGEAPVVTHCKTKMGISGVSDVLSNAEHIRTQ